MHQRIGQRHGSPPGSPPGTEAGISPSYWWWLFGTVWTLLGTQILSFGLSWAASANGGVAAGLVLTAVTLPRVIFSLHGGVAADRSGPWKTMIRTDAFMFCVSAAAAVLVFSLGTPLWLLLSTAVLLGTADAFYRPASGSFPRFLTPGTSLLRATAARQALIQLTAAAGPAAGGFVVAWLTLAGSAAGAAVGYLFMFLVLLSLRRAATGNAGDAAPEAAGPGTDGAPGPGGMPRVPAPRRSVLVEAADGLRLAWSLPQVRAVLGLLAAVSGLVLPLTTLLVPLLARSRGWDAAAAGTVSGGYAAGMAVVVLVIVARGRRAFAWFPPVAGLVLCGGAMVAMACIPGVVLCGGLSVVAGLGTGIFSAKAAPLLLLAVPESYLGRVQSVALLAQMVPLLAANNLLGWLSDVIGPAPVIAGCGAATALIAACFLGRPALRGLGRHN
ncbi:MFS transporter [Arthrobacter sp. Z1-15]